MIRRRIVLPIILPVLLLMALVPSASAVTTTTLEYRILGWINQARAERHLVPLRADSRVWDLAGDRSAVMAPLNVLSHTVAGYVGSQLTSRGVRWYRWGETIGYSVRSPGANATAELFALWKASRPHWDILMSPKFNYIGIGMTYRSSTGRTFGDVILIDGPDRSRPGAAMVSVSRTGDDVRWTWRGWDTRLQTRTSGLASFQVQYRVGSGAFRTIVTSTTGTSRLLINRSHGHWHGARVRARDKAGNVGAWSSEMRIWVP
jgi:hypothetical protein